MPAMFKEPFSPFGSMFEGTLNGPGAMLDNFPPVSRASEAGERIIPIKVVTSNSDVNEVRRERIERISSRIINCRLESVRVEITKLEMFQLRSVEMKC